ncbi:InlB B-repeat-containing protein [Chloroflexi bacterium TSY]|nr:InlB B-repeat-containing protein [Chloroflexi bacterium TSY]
MDLLSLQPLTSNNVQIEVIALSNSATVLGSFPVENLTDIALGVWQRFGQSMTMPIDTQKARVQITTQGLTSKVMFDNLLLERAQGWPRPPLPISQLDGHEFRTLQPTLAWSDISNATAFRLQIATDQSFTKPIKNIKVSSLTYTVPNGLVYDTRYFWRVRAINGVGGGGWSHVFSFILRQPPNHYGSEFESHSLEPLWSWVREDSSRWQFDGPLNRRRNGYLGISTQAGDLRNSNNAKNLLLRPSPSGDFEMMTTVNFWGVPNSNAQQGGLLLYQDDDNYMKLMRIYDQGHKLEFLAENSGLLIEKVDIAQADPLPIKLVRIGDTYSAFYSVDGLTWHKLGQTVSASWPQPYMGVTAYDVASPTSVTAYFDWFRVQRPCYTLAVDTWPFNGGTATVQTDNLCGTNRYYPDSTLTIQATPAIGYEFSGWTGSVSGTTNPAVITLNQHSRITANFKLIEYRVNAITNPPEGGSIIRTPDQSTYHYGDLMTLTAIATTGWDFIGWSGDITGNGLEQTLTVTANHDVLANFVPVQYTVNATAKPPEGGSISYTPDQSAYHHGDQITLTAVPSSGWSFTGWSGDVTGNALEQTLKVTGNHSIQANFAPVQYTINTTANPPKGGSIIHTPNQSTYHHGDLVTLIAVPSSGWSFTGWSGDITGNGLEQILKVTGNHSVQANFAPVQYTINTTANPPKGGSIIHTPNQSTYHHGDQITLTAVPSSGWSFTGWSGDVAGNGLEQTLTVTANHDVQANFVPIQYKVNATAKPSEGGTISYTPDQSAYHHGDQITLTAVPSSGWSFTGWSGDITSNALEQTLKVTGNHSVQANFVPIQYTVNATAKPSEGGSISYTPDQSAYHHGDLVSLTAVPSSGWSFTGWSGDVTGNGLEQTLTVTGNHIIQANFVSTQYTVNATANPPEGGSIIHTPNQSTYHHGDLITLTAVTATGWSFTGWSGDITGNGLEQTLTVTGNHDIQANFVQIQYLVNAKINPPEGGSIIRTPDQSIYHQGDLITLTAVPSSGWSFTGWSGDITGNALAQTLTVANNHVFTATFAQHTYSLTLQIEDGSGASQGGAVLPTPTGPYSHGQEVTLQAIPELGWRFVKWSGDLLQGESLREPTLTVTITEDASYIAHFAPDGQSLRLYLPWIRR